MFLNLKNYMHFAKHQILQKFAFYGTFNLGPDSHMLRHLGLEVRTPVLRSGPRGFELLNLFVFSHVRSHKKRGPDLGPQLFGFKFEILHIKMTFIHLFSFALP